MDYKYLKHHGALHEGAERDGGHARRTLTQAEMIQYLKGGVPKVLVNLVPAQAAEKYRVVPVAYDGERVTLATDRANDLAFQDQMRFLLGKDVAFMLAPADLLDRAVAREYGGRGILAKQQTSSMRKRATRGGEWDQDEMLQEFTETAIDATYVDPLPGAAMAPPARASRSLSNSFGTASAKAVADYKKGVVFPEIPAEGNGVFFFVVDEGQKVLMRHPNGKLEILTGPRKIWKGKRTFRSMAHHVAHPGEFLIIRFRDGQQEHIAGPAEIWFDPRVHESIVKEDALQLAAKEAVVVYSRSEETGQVARRLVYGPALFVPEPGEWLHTFSWHASRGGSQGAEKVANALVFQKLWLMPDQMYHDVHDVRTADDAVLMIRLMIFFELLDIERMLDTTHDPIGDFVNAATSDVVEFTGKHDFESFKRHTDQLNELTVYKQLTSRAAQCGYRLNKVVYRGYGAPDSLQQMHNQAIEARTRLQLERANEQQAQDLENYRLDSQLERSSKRRREQSNEVEHELDLNRKRTQAELQQQADRHQAEREEQLKLSQLRLQIQQQKDLQTQQKLAALKEMGVDLTEYLTQGRADRVIELRGANGTHVHLDHLEGNSGLPSSDEV